MDAIEIARRLIAIPTVSDIHSTREIADVASNLLNDFGFVVEHHTYQRNNIEKVNVIARKGEGRPKLALSGHLDTVPFTADEWQSDPLKFTERGGKFYGRGACDMKGFIGLAIAAGARISAEDIDHPFALVLTSDEEVGCIGAKNLVREKGSIADMFVIGEPTGFKPFILHKGYMYLRVTFRGKTGHSSRPAGGVNVIERAVGTVIERLNSFKREFEQIRDDRLDPPYPTLNIGTLNTGPGAAKNMIADRCTLELDIRPIPGQDIEDILSALRSHVAPDGMINGVEVSIALARAPTPPFQTDGSSAIVKEMESISGASAVSTSFNTEGGIFNLAGSQSVICGLGNIEQAHKPNEFVAAHFLGNEMVERYERLIRNMCARRKL